MNLQKIDHTNELSEGRALATLDRARDNLAPFMRIKAGKTAFRRFIDAGCPSFRTPEECSSYIELAPQAKDWDAQGSPYKRAYKMILVGALLSGVQGDTIKERARELCRDRTLTGKLSKMIDKMGPEDLNCSVQMVVLGCGTPVTVVVSGGQYFEGLEVLKRPRVEGTTSDYRVQINAYSAMGTDDDSMDTESDDSSKKKPEEKKKPGEPKTGDSSLVEKTSGGSKVVIQKLTPIQVPASDTTGSSTASSSGVQSAKTFPVGPLIPGFGLGKHLPPVHEVAVDYQSRRPSSSRRGDEDEQEFRLFEDEPDDDRDQKSVSRKDLFRPRGGKH